jgi:hypothetical protein
MRKTYFPAGRKMEHSDPNPPGNRPTLTKRETATASRCRTGTNNWSRLPEEISPRRFCLRVGYRLAIFSLLGALGWAHNWLEAEVCAAGSSVEGDDRLVIVAPRGGPGALEGRGVIRRPTDT